MVAEGSPPGADRRRLPCLRGARSEQLCFLAPLLLERWDWARGGEETPRRPVSCEGDALWAVTTTTTALCSGV